MNLKLRDDHIYLIKNFLKEYRETSFIISSEFFKKNPYVFDFTKNNRDFSNVDMGNTMEFQKYIDKKIKENNSLFGMGGYGEERVIYSHSDLFKGKDVFRSVHLGIDLWLPEKTQIYCPLKGEVHSFKDNNNLGDYGPTIILKHSFNNFSFYTLYGHLSKSSLYNLKKGMVFNRGEEMVKVGTFLENGSWPSHLHFQIILDLLGKEGDFFGVTSREEKDYYLKICPDPNLILRINNFKLRN